MSAIVVNLIMKGGKIMLVLTPGNNAIEGCLLVCKCFLGCHFTKPPEDQNWWV